MKKLKILVVDDVVLNRILITEILEEGGYGYKTANNGKEALEIYSKEDFDLILMDIEMPIMNGFETTRFIRQKLTAPKNYVPIVAITAHDPNTFFEEYEGVGFNELICKPYTLEKLQKIILTL